MIALAACVPNSVSIKQGKGFTCFCGDGMGWAVLGICLYLCLGLLNLWLQDFFLFGENLLSSEECRACNRSSQIKGRWTAWGSFDIKQRVC